MRASLSLSPPLLTFARGKGEALQTLTLPWLRQRARFLSRFKARER